LWLKDTSMAEENEDKKVINPGDGYDFVVH